LPAAEPPTPVPPVLAPALEPALPA
jgi:hypothetical protein